MTTREQNAQIVLYTLMVLAHSGPSRATVGIQAGRATGPLAKPMGVTMQAKSDVSGEQPPLAQPEEARRQGGGPKSQAQVKRYLQLLPYATKVCQG